MGSFNGSTISSYFGIIGVIGDGWLGTPIPQLSWNLSNDYSSVHMMGVLSSLDYTHSYLVTFLTEFGAIEDHETRFDERFQQRPALRNKHQTS